MSIPSQREQPEMTLADKILKVSSDPDVALLEVVLEELNRLNGEVIGLKRKVATLENANRALGNHPGLV